MNRFTATGRPCATEKCPNRTRSTISRFCERCRSRRRRHGDAAVSRGIWLKELQPYITRVRRLIRRGNPEKVEQALTTLYHFLKDYARDELADRETRSLQGPVWERQALGIIGHVLEEAKPLDVGITLAAVWLMRAREPWRFATDQAFRWDVVRMFRKLASTSYGSYWSEYHNRAVRLYKMLRPATIETLATILVEVYAKWASRVIAADEAERAERKDARTLMDEGLTPHTK